MFKCQSQNYEIKSIKFQTYDFEFWLLLSLLISFSSSVSFTRTNYGTPCSSSSPTSRISRTPWVPQSSPTSSVYVRCLVASGTSRRRALPRAKASTRASTGSPTSSPRPRGRRAKLHVANVAGFFFFSPSSAAWRYTTMFLPFFPGHHRVSLFPFHLLRLESTWFKVRLNLKKRKSYISCQGLPSWRKKRGTRVLWSSNW